MKKEQEPSVFVMNISYTGLGLARSLAREGIRVYGVGSNKSACGRFSRYLTFLFSPDSLTQPNNLCRFLIDHVQGFPQKPLLFPTRDHDVNFLRSFRNALDPYFVIPQSSDNSLDLVFNKWKLHGVAKKIGIPMPNTFLVHNTDEILSVSKKVRYPALLKPVYASDWRTDFVWNLVGMQKVIFARSKNDLLSSYQRIHPFVPKTLVQEYIEGDESDIYTFCSYCNKNSEVLTSFNTRKIRQVPEMFGTGVVVESAINKDLTEPSVKLLKTIGYHGISEIEYKKDRRTGAYCLIEVNPRFWDQHLLSKSFGINLPLIVYNDLIGKNIHESIKMYHSHTWIAEDTYLHLLLDHLVRRRGDVLKLISEVKGRRCYATWSLTDPLPFIHLMFSKILTTAKHLKQRRMRKTSECCISKI
ncbi:MAG: ATP-grasp domain-containing protein [Syntrophaceae bacterium]|nr:ATP-grasp domain-containing protein [Syntrophaceae bacterium]